MTVLVCGGRNYHDQERLFAELDALHELRGFTLVVHGAARGADRLAGAWARARGIPEIGYPADWKKYERPGKKNPAGMIRNQQMLESEHPALVVAFPGGPGTAAMVRLARAAGVEVICNPRRCASPARHPNI